VILFALSVIADMVISIGPKPNIKPSLRVLSVSVAFGANGTVQFRHDDVKSMPEKNPPTIFILIVLFFISTEIVPNPSWNFIISKMV